ncbi:MAG: GAF domain-containing protein, partial [Candidatus Omnitrophica bacterium]|nr:GAF domain-containing protein [Candidatus Omnitrophota bacterium]
GCPTLKVFNGCEQCVAIRKGIAINGLGKHCFRLTTSPIKDEHGKIVQVLELAEDVTDQVKAEQEIKRRLNVVTKELNFLSRLDRDFISLQELSLDQILKQCVEISQSLLDSKICNLRLFDGSQKTLISKASSGLEDELLKGLKVGDGICGKAAASKKPVLIMDLLEFKQLKDDSSVRKSGLRSAVCVPIMLKDELLGTLAVLSPQPNAFTNEEAKLLMCFANHVAILIDNLKAHKEIFTSYVNTIKSLVSAIEARDSYTRGHSEKVTKFSLDIADAMGLSEEHKAMLTYCGRLHDIGKIGISDAILNKPGPLTVAERAEIQLHPLRAVDILSSLKFLDKGMPAIRHHHERFDGRGYPDGLKGKDIPLLARILTCADSFDAMTSDRAYRPGMSMEKAVLEMKASREKQFDPEVTDAFIGILEGHRR